MMVYHKFRPTFLYISFRSLSSLGKKYILGFYQMVRLHIRSYNLVHKLRYIPYLRWQTNWQCVSGVDFHCIYAISASHTKFHSWIEIKAIQSAVLSRNSNYYHYLFIYELKKLPHCYLLTLLFIIGNRNQRQEPQVQAAMSEILFWDCLSTCTAVGESCSSNPCKHFRSTLPSDHTVSISSTSKQASNLSKNKL